MRPHTVFEGATVFDGTGAAAYTADVSIREGLIHEIGTVRTAAAQRIDARGAWLTPGFIDLHTHYDGQTSWDQTFSPSIHHGVTTVLFGNCEVGFARLGGGPRERATDNLISLMKGVEDIPGAVLAEGVSFDWQSFPEYLDALERRPHSLDFLVQLSHDPLRMAVMGERALERQSATREDVAAMRRLLREALQGNPPTGVGD
jgi:N-acyl-D-aspartate/D-glutamate deacylase